MQNHFPLWKNLLILSVLMLGIMYSLPNLYGNDPSVQISVGDTPAITDLQLAHIKSTLIDAAITAKAIELQGNKVLLRFNNTDDQIHAADLWRNSLGNQYIVALNLAPATPNWLRLFNAKPMYLGLDLRGGVHFLLEVDTATALKQAKERYNSEIRIALRTTKIRYKSVTDANGTIKVVLRNEKDKLATIEVIDDEFSKLDMRVDKTLPVIYLSISTQETQEIKQFALAQNMTTLRNRVNELGVSEPIIQQQGDKRIAVQLPGVQDTTRAKEILGTTATLEYRKVDTKHDVQSAVNGQVPIGSSLYFERDTKAPVLLKRRVIITGDQIIDASSGLDQNGSASVNITLNSIGAKKMGKFTKDNIGQPMAVVFIEQKSTTSMVQGKKVRHKEKIAEVISIATVRDVFSKRFQTTGLDSTQEARKLSLLLRAGALAAPVDIVEERTVGPSLGQDNINKGMLSVLIGFILVLIFMSFYYKTFGLIANLALTFNLFVIVAVLSMLQATLTLPGIAGIVLTVGMAVDANVLIFERIKEELRNKNSPQTSIFLGYEKAFATIFDANITTLLVALVLFGFGTGPIKGFAITLAVGILTSMFTAILGSRMAINWIYGTRQRLDKLSI